MSFTLVGVNYMSPSQAATMVGCERKWWHSYVDGIKEPSSEPLAMGGGFALALEEQNVEAGLREYVARRPAMSDWVDASVYERQEWIGRATILRAFDGYTFRWPDVDVEREVTYLVSLPGTERLLQCRVDGVHPEYQVEDKLRSGTAMRSHALENEVRQGFQLTAEIYGRWRSTGELLPVHLRCVKKCDPRKYKECESFDDVNAVAATHFDAEASFQEFVAVRTVEQLREFERDAVELCQRADRLGASDTPLGAKNTSNCHAYGRACPNLDLCQGMSTEKGNDGTAN